MKPIIDVRQLSKEFKIGVKAESYLTIRDILSNPFSNKEKKPNTFLALDDISFTVNAGESIGIIGRNGAGKSTLLKILSRITPPSSGKIICRGRIASLLEVGTGFHPELTGRENIYMNGSILGMRRSEIEKHFDDIVEFSGVEKFIDTPLKRYSSGMQLRLAFAVAAHLEPEILIIDEVLAVGDAEFQKKCLGKMDEVSKSGRTVLFVSHDMNAVEQLCTKTIILQKGKILQYGDTHKLIGDYLNANKDFNANNLWLTKDVQLQELSFSPKEIMSGHDISFSIKLGYADETPLITDLCLLVYSLKGVRICIVDLRPYLTQFIQEGNTIVLQVLLEKLNLVEGEYLIGIFYSINDIRKEILDITQIRIRPDLAKSPTVNPYMAQHRGYVELINNIKIN